MPYCRAISIPGGGTALVRFAGKRPICFHCGKDSAKLCDYPSGPGKKTCDRKLCVECSTHIQPDIDLCKEHSKWQPKQLSL